MYENRIIGWLPRIQIVANLGKEGLKLVHRLRRCSHIKPALGQCLVFLGILWYFM